MDIGEGRLYIVQRSRRFYACTRTSLAFRGLAFELDQDQRERFIAQVFGQMLPRDQPASLACLGFLLFGLAIGTS